MIGRNFMDRYQIVAKLGSGGTAVVYKAIDTVLNREVTVKILQEQFTSNQKFVMRFRKEAQAIAALSHPNIVSVYDVGCSDEGEPYLIMEYVEGKTLKEIINKMGPLSLDRSLDYVHQILAGLNHAHSYGVIHRDIKPQNIMITPEGQVKIMDFGLAMNLTDTTITYDTSVFGSVYYIAPEIAQKGSGDARVDIYSTGIVLYEMLTCQLPYTGDSPITIALQHVEGDYTPIDEIDEDIPYEVARIVDKAMSVDPADRYRNTQIMMGDIETAADEYDVILTPIQMTSGTKPQKTRTRSAVNDPDDYDEYEERRSSRRDRSSSRQSREADSDRGRGSRKKKKEKSNKKLVIAIVVIALAIVLFAAGGFALINKLLPAKKLLFLRLSV
ncbi:MAG: protein kinase [Clostridia bacterium]